jgi:SAM-dependent methyltransferase
MTTPPTIAPPQAPVDLHATTGTNATADPPGGESRSEAAALPFDEARAEAFVGQMVGVLRDGSLALLCHLGHEVGLFDAMAGLGDATSEGIAEVAGLDERYVREWLGGATTGGIVEHDPDRDTYLLPAEHAASLTRDAGPNNLARTLGFLPLLAQVDHRVAEAFHHGGGVPYEAYERFHHVMAEESAAVFDDALLDTTLPLVEGLPDRLATGISVADVGCGSGRAINLMARAYPKSSFVGYDLSERAVEVARAEARGSGLDNVRFEVQDAAEWHAPATYDLITAFDAIHDQAHPARVLERIHDALRADGTFLMVDINASSRLHDNLDHPLAPFLYTVSLMHCMTVSLAMDGRGLGTVWGRQRALAMLDDAGFERVEVRQIEADPLNLYYVATKR